MEVAGACFVGAVMSPVQPDIPVTLRLRSSFLHDSAPVRRVNDSRERVTEAPVFICSARDDERFERPSPDSASTRAKLSVMRAVVPLISLMSSVAPMRPAHASTKSAAGQCISQQASDRIKEPCAASGSSGAALERAAFIGPFAKNRNNGSRWRAGGAAATAIPAMEKELEIGLPDVPIASRGIVLMDCKTGKLLIKINPHVRMEPASLTKMMTAYVISTKLADGTLKLNDLVTVRPAAAHPSTHLSPPPTPFPSSSSTHPHPSLRTLPPPPPPPQHTHTLFPPPPLSLPLPHPLRPGRPDEARAQVSQKAWTMGGSKMFLGLGELVPVKDLLTGIMAVSANDACVAMAEHIGGSEENFVQMMNQEAAKLGMRRTHFSNVHGLPVDNHYTTARDMAVLARALIYRYPNTYKLCSVRIFTWNGITQTNRNPMLYTRSLNADGIKTGFTNAAGFCLAASAEQGGVRLVSVTLGAPTEYGRALDNKRLLSFGLRYLKSEPPIAART
eukprot:tig00021464_g21719.t1